MAFTCYRCSAWPCVCKDGCTLLQGDCLEVLPQLEAGSVNCCVTSPPYWNLRDYGIEGQVGLERSPLEFVEKLTQIFSEVRRVLKDDGTLWLNIGDTYCNAKGTAHNPGGRVGPNECFHSPHKDAGAIPLWRPNKSDAEAWGMKGKDLCGVPWMVAFSLRSNGWYLRNDIVWHKPNPMPESVTDRCTKAHEYIFLFAKSETYYYNADAIKTEWKDSSLSRCGSGWNGNKKRDWPGSAHNNFDRYWENATGDEPANKRDVWTVDDHEALLRWLWLAHPDIAEEYVLAGKPSVWSVTTRSYKHAHFATFPPDLIKPCILAGCPQGGTVLDPFHGSGTTAMVARNNQCKAVGIELNPEYLELSANRLRQEVLAFQD